MIVLADYSMAATASGPVEDFLSEDPEISSQKIVLLSFLSPDKILENKDVFFFQSFLKDYELQWRTSKLEAWMAQQVQSLNSKLETLAGKLDALDLSGAAQELRAEVPRVDSFVEGFQAFTRSSLKDSTPGSIQKEYEDFMYKNSAKLEEAFFAKNEFRTTIRGIKVRGVFASEAEASVRAKRLQKSDPNFNIYMGGVGKWMAWEPDPNKVVEQEYANEQLNTLMKKYRENEEDKEQFFSQQKGARTSGATKASAPLGEQGEAESAPADVSVTSASSASNDSMFSGTGDLAIARKAAAAASSAATDAQ